MNRQTNPDLTTERLRELHPSTCFVYNAEGTEVCIKQLGHDDPHGEDWDVWQSDGDEDVHAFFGLSYANYLVVPRTVLQSQPREWQARFVQVMKELERWCRENDIEYGPYSVVYNGEKGRFGPDPIPPYDRGRARVGSQPLMEVLAQYEDDETV